jgi:peptide subunit release factor 1 (eRF1)
MATDLQSTLETLTALPSTDSPFLSVYLDWTPDGNGNRQSLRALQDELDLIAERMKDRSTEREGFEADRERIMNYVNNEAPVDARSLAIFACSAEGIWETIPLQVPVPTQIVEDRFPHTFNLARIVDDYETYAVVLADAQESRILVISLNEAEQAAETESAEPIKRFEAGGWGQMLFQRRTENLVKAHTKEISDTLSRIIKRYDVKHVIIAGNDSIKGAVMGSLTNDITDKLVDYINLDITGNLPSIMEVIEPMMRDVERAQEADDVAQLEGEVGRQGLGVVGVSETALALTKGQVDTLIMHQNFVGTGGECPNCGTIRAGLRPKCPYDGTEMQQIDLREAFTARALQQGSAIQIVEESEYLDQHEGVGALLRYRDTQQTQTV